MNKLITIIATFVVCQAAQAHGFRFEGGVDSNAQIVFNGLMEAAATDSSMVVVKGYYGSSVTKEDPVAAIRCANQSAREFSCKIAMKHDRPLDPFETYPLGNTIDPYGDASSVSALLAKILAARGGSDDSVEVLELSQGSQVVRESDDATIDCTTSKDQAGASVTKCHIQQ